MQTQLKNESKYNSIFESQHQQLILNKVFTNKTIVSLMTHFIGNAKGISYSNQQQLAERIGKSISTVKRSIKALKDNHFITVQFTGAGSNRCEIRHERFKELSHMVEGSYLSKSIATVKRNQEAYRQNKNVEIPRIQGGNSSFMNPIYKPNGLLTNRINTTAYKKADYRKTIVSESKLELHKDWIPVQTWNNTIKNKFGWTEELYQEELNNWRVSTIKKNMGNKRHDEWEALFWHNCKRSAALRSHYKEKFRTPIVRTQWKQERELIRIEGKHEALQRYKQHRLRRLDEGPIAKLIKADFLSLLAIHKPLEHIKAMEPKRICLSVNDSYDMDDVLKKYGFG